MAVMVSLLLNCGDNKKLEKNSFSVRISDLISLNDKISTKSTLFIFQDNINGFHFITNRFLCIFKHITNINRGRLFHIRIVVRNSAFVWICNHLHFGLINFHLMATIVHYSVCIWRLWIVCIVKWFFAEWILSMRIAKCNVYFDLHAMPGNAKMIYFYEIFVLFFSILQRCINWH